MRQSTHAWASAGCFLFNGAAMAVIIILWCVSSTPKEKEKELSSADKPELRHPSLKVIRTPTEVTPAGTRWPIYLNKTRSRAPRSGSGARRPRWRGMGLLALLLLEPSQPVLGLGGCVVRETCQQCT